MTDKEYILTLTKYIAERNQFINSLNTELAENDKDIKLLRQQSAKDDYKIQDLEEDIRVLAGAFEEDKENFAIAFAVWALHDPQAQAYQSAGITAYELLEKYKSRAYIDNSNPTNQ